MKRTVVLAMATMTYVVTGCGVATYEARLTKTLDDRKYEQKLDENLTKATQEKYKELRIWLRPPQPLTKAPIFGLTQTPGMYEVEDTFSGSPVGEKTGNDPAPALPPLKLHVLARVKPKENKKKKEGEPEVARAGRGKFLDDVRNLLANDLGPEAASVALKDETKKGGRKYKRMIFPGPNGDTVQVYFSEVQKGEIETALIFDIPQALAKNKSATTGIELCLETFALGSEAGRLFSGGGTSEDDVSAGAGAAPL